MIERYGSLKVRVSDAMKGSGELASRYGSDFFKESAQLKSSQLDEQLFSIAVVGFFKRGKSTLINAILGRENDLLAPIDAPPCTSSIVRYFSVERSPEGRESAVVNFLPKVGDKGEILDPDPDKVIPFDEVREYVTEDSNRDNFKRVSSVDIFCESSLLNRYVCLVDTPGKGTFYKNHEGLLEGYLPLANALVFVISSGSALDPGELEFLKGLSADERRRVFFVLTKVDLIGDEELDTVKARVRGEIEKAGIVCEQLYTVSAKEVFEARQSRGSKKSLGRNNQWNEFTSDLGQFVLREAGESGVARLRFEQALSLSDDALQYVRDIIEERLSFFDKPLSQVEKEKKQVESARSSIEEQTAESRHAFRKEWEKARQRFHERVQGRGSAVAGAILTLVDSVTTMGLIKASSSIGSAIENKLRPIFEDAGEELDRSLRQAVHNLFESTRESFERNAPAAPIATDLGLVPAAAAVTVSGVVAGGVALGTGIAIGGPAIVTFLEATLGLAGAGSITQILVLIKIWMTTLAAVPGGIVAVAGGYLVCKALLWVSGALGRHVLEEKAKSAVEETIETFLANADKQIEQARATIEEEYKKNISRALQNATKRLDDIEETIRTHGPKARHELESDMALVNERLNAVKGIRRELDETLSTQQP